MSVYDTLNKEQKKAVLTTEGPLLLLAGAGSGKTRVLTHRIAYLIEELGVSPWNILAITFTNKAAEEMRERLNRIIGFGAEQIWAATFHSTCVRILRRHIDRLGFDNHFTIYDADDQKSVVKDICKRFGIDTKQTREKEFLNVISSAKDKLISPLEYRSQTRGDFTKRRYGEVYEEYQEVLRRNNALDFDDLIVKTVELFKTCPEVLENYQNRFCYISVDEYQDTNRAQFELIRLLAEKSRNLCVVGDDDQSIYKFRGADIRNILNFEQVYPEAKVIKLEQNYRSTGNILNAANAVIRHNKGRKDKALWTDRGEGSNVHFRQFDTAYEEADYIVGDIVSKVSGGTRKFGDFAVLYRTNAQSRLLEERLITEGIPYDVVGGVNFYSRREIKDVLAYLKTIDNGLDEVAVKRIINIPKRGIGPSTIARLDDYAQMRDISFYEALEDADNIMDLGRPIAKINAFVTLIRTFRTKAEFMSISDLILDILEKIDYKSYVDSFAEEDAEDRIHNVEELVNKAVSFQEARDQGSLSEFLEEVALVADIDNMNDDGNRVLLMTLHSAKGLEFPAVYMAGMEDGLFPSYQAANAEDPSELEEERRLAYVGITRTKEDLTLTSARTRMLRGETQYNTVSRFVKEIPEELLDGGTVWGRKQWQRMGEGGDDFGNGTAWGRSARKGAGSFAAAENGSSRSEARDFRPKAVLRPKTTAKADKPFIAKGMDSLNRLAGVSKGMPKQAPAAVDYAEGDRVSHVKYGLGTVLHLEKDVRDIKVTVDFDRAGQKIMYASFAKLKKV